MKRFASWLRLYEVSHPNKKRDKINDWGQLAPHVKLTHVGSGCSAVNNQLEEGVNTETKGKSEYSVFPRHSEMLGAHEQEQEQRTLHQTDDLLEVIDSDN